VWLSTLIGVVLLEGALITHTLSLDVTAPAMLAASCVIVGIVVSGRSIVSSLSPRVIGTAVVALSGMGLLVSALRLGATLDLPAWAIISLGGSLVLAAIASAALELRRPRYLTVAMAMVLIALGGLMIEGNRDRGNTVDVAVFQDLGAGYLLGGENPYTGDYPNIYSPEASKRFYGEGLADEEGLAFGFPYAPLSLFMAVPGEVMLDDFRYGQLAAIVVAFLFMSAGANGRPGRVAGALLITFPLQFDLIVGGWTEPYLVALMAALVWAVSRRSRVIPYLYGLMLASKISLFVVAPLYLLVDVPVFGREGRIGRWAKVALTGAVVTLPLAVLDLDAFWFSVVELQFLQPFRPDALSLLVWADTALVDLPAWSLAVVPIGAAAAGVAYVLRFARSASAGLAVSAAFVTMVWLAFTKQSFLNHYYFALGALLLGLAFAHRDEAGQGDVSVPTGTTASTVSGDGAAAMAPIDRRRPPSPHRRRA
jgi:hypothetical protein